MIINQEITKGSGFISYSGHGFEYGFGTSPPNSDQKIMYYSPYLLGLMNNGKYPIIFFDACLTASLDYNFYGIKLPCFAWSIIKKPSSGAIASIGATRVAFGGNIGNPFFAGAAKMNKEFFEAYDEGIILSDMFTTAQTKYINDLWPIWKDCMTIEQFIIIGDPSLKVGGY